MSERKREKEERARYMQTELQSARGKLRHSQKGPQTGAQSSNEN